MEYLINGYDFSFRGKSPTPVVIISHGRGFFSEVSGRSLLPVFSLRSVASVLVEATAFKVVNALIFLNKIQEIKDICQSQFSVSIF